MAEASVVIATRDRAPLLRACLKHLARQAARGRFEVVVVDNGSSDATPQVIASAGVRAASVREPNRARARNAGIAAAQGRIVIFVDDDTLPPEGFVEAHLRQHERAGARVVTGPIVNVLNPESLPPPGPQHYSRAFFCTCNASVRKEDLEAVGGFDDRYELYGWEDTDLGVRLRARGLKRAFSWEAFIYHYKPAQTQELERRVELAREKGAMAARFVRKTPTWPVKLATGANPANLARGWVVNARPLRGIYERLATNPSLRETALGALARDLLVDAAYLDALRANLRLEKAAQRR